MILAVAAAVAACLPLPGMFVAMSLGIGAIGIGLAAYRRRADPGGRRLWGAGAIAVGGAALILAALRYALTLTAVGTIESLIRT